MQPTDQAAESAQTRPETPVERVATLIQAARRGELTPYDAAQRVLAALGHEVNAPLPPSPPTRTGAEDEERAASGITSSPLPPPLSRRDAFAAAALTGLLASGHFTCVTEENGPWFIQERAPRYNDEGEQVGTQTHTPLIDAAWMAADMMIKAIVP